MSNNNETKVVDIAEARNLKLEKMRYINNSLSYKLGLGGIAFSVLACFLALNSLAPSNVLTVFKIILNILVLLIGFLATEKVKVYNRGYANVSIVLGAISAARIFWYPLQLFIYYPKFVNAFEAAGSTEAAFNEANLMYSTKLGKTVLGKFLVGADGITGTIGGTGYLTHNGIVRAIVITVALALSALCFISSGIICHAKAKALNGYLTSIGQKK